MNTSKPTSPMTDAELGRRLADEPVAIVGLSALFPKSRDLREFWGNVMAAADCIEDVTSTHWDVAEHYDPDPSAPDKTYARRGGFIPPTAFNPMEFGLPPTTLVQALPARPPISVVHRRVLPRRGLWKLPELWTPRSRPHAPWKTHRPRFPQLPQPSSSICFHEGLQKWYRGIPPRGVARRLHMATMLAPCALRSGCRPPAIATDSAETGH